MKFTFEIEIPERLVGKLATYSFLKKEEWTRFADKGVLLPAKQAGFIQQLVNTQLSKMRPNKTWHLIENLPEASQLLVLERLNVRLIKKKGWSIREVIMAIEEENNCQIIFGILDETVTAYMLPRHS